MIHPELTPLRGLLLLVLLLLPAAQMSPLRAADGAFGFSDLLVFRLSSAGGPWHSTDLDADGDQDLVVWDSNRGELILLLRDPEVVGFTHREGGNTLVDPDGWSRISIPVRTDVEALGSGDLDADGYPDLILCCPDANRIEIRWGAADSSRFRTELRIRLREIARGDQTLDIDTGNPEGPVIRVLSKEGIHEIRDVSRDGVPDIETLTGTAANPISIHRADIDGDGHEDLLTFSTAATDRLHPLRLRPGTVLGWGAEILLEAEDARLLGVAPTAEGTLLMMSDRSRPVLRGVRLNRGRGRQLLPNPDVYPLSPEGIGAGDFAVGDIDGDGDPDIVISDRKSSLLRPFWNEGGSLRAGVKSPTLKQPRSLLIHRGQVIVTSPEEGGAGSSVPQKSGFSFPALIDGDEIDSLIGIAGTDDDSPLVSLHVVKDPDRSSRSKPTYRLIEWPIVGGNSILLKSDREPSALHLFPDTDGTRIAVVEIPFETPRFFRFGDNQIDPIQIPATVESGGSVQAGADGQLLIAREGRCRIISVDKSEAHVLRQIDAPGGSARVVQAIPVHLDDGGRAQMVLVDAGQHLLHLCDETGVYASVEGPYQKVKRARTIDLDGDGFDEILLLDERSLLVIRPAQLEWTATEVFTRRHEEENGRSTALALGDLNDDGITDLIVVDGVRSELEIFAGGNNLFSSALRFPVFEKKLFRGGGRAIEPRRVMVQDFDGDGLQDVAILVHDRLIIYPQDPTGGVR
jgi:hypothetical protein